MIPDYTDPINHSNPGGPGIDPILQFLSIRSNGSGARRDFDLRLWGRWDRELALSPKVEELFEAAILGGAIGLWLSLGYMPGGGRPILYFLYDDIARLIFPNAVPIAVRRIIIGIVSGGIGGILFDLYY